MKDRLIEYQCASCNSWKTSEASAHQCCEIATRYSYDPKDYAVGKYYEAHDSVIFIIAPGRFVDIIVDEVLTEKDTRTLQNSYDISDILCDESEPEEISIFDLRQRLAVISNRVSDYLEDITAFRDSLDIK